VYKAYRPYVSLSTRRSGYLARNVFDKFIVTNNVHVMFKKSILKVP